jgi:hypothetical protein
MVNHLVRAEPLAPGTFEGLLGASLQVAEESPFWKRYTFELHEGPFSHGELRLNTPGNSALLILEPRDPPGLGESDVDRKKLGPRLGMRPNPRIPPEGIETEYFQKEGVQVATQWTHGSRRLRSLVLRWETSNVAALETPPVPGSPSA